MDDIAKEQAGADLERRILLRATVSAGAIAGVAATIPFFASLAPSERALSEGAPVLVNLNDIPPGEMLSVAWRGRPVWTLHRTPAMIESLQRRIEMLSDPMSNRSDQPVNTRTALRSVQPSFAILVGICTHLGCVPFFRPEVAAADLGDTWPGGFYCPCHGSKFDLAGRVFKNVPAPLNLAVPPHQFLTGGLLRIGE